MMTEHRHRQTQTDRQRQTETDRQRQTETDRQRQTDTDRHRQTEADRRAGCVIKLVKNHPAGSRGTAPGGSRGTAPRGIQGHSLQQGPGEQPIVGAWRTKSLEAKGLTKL